MTYPFSCSCWGFEQGGICSKAFEMQRAQGCWSYWHDIQCNMQHSLIGSTNNQSEHINIACVFSTNTHQYNVVNLRTSKCRPASGPPLFEFRRVTHWVWLCHANMMCPLVLLAESINLHGPGPRIPWRSALCTSTHQHHVHNKPYQHHGYIDKPNAWCEEHAQHATPIQTKPNSTCTECCVMGCPHRTGCQTNWPTTCAHSTWQHYGQTYA